MPARQPSTVAQDLRRSFLRRERTSLADGELLAMPREREEQLRLKRRAAAAGVEIGEERILGVVANDGGVDGIAHGAKGCRSLGDKAR